MRANQLTDEIARLRFDEDSRQTDGAELKDRIAGHQSSIEIYEENLIPSREEIRCGHAGGSRVPSQVAGGKALST